MMRGEADNSHGSADPSNKRKLRQRSPSPRPRKQSRHLEAQHGTFTSAVKAADRATDEALTHLFTNDNTDECDPELDQVVGAVYDEDFIRSALHLAGARMTQWTQDKITADGDESRRRQVIARLKKRWAMKLLPHVVEVLDAELELASTHLCLETHGGSGRYRIELNVNPIFEIDDTEDELPQEEAMAPGESVAEQDDSENEDYDEEDYDEDGYDEKVHEEEEYVSSPVTSVARRPMASGQAAQANFPHGNLQTTVQINAAADADNRSLVSSAFHSPPQTPPENTIPSQFCDVRFYPFPAFDPEGLLMLQLPKEGQQPLDEFTLREKLSRAIVHALQGKIARHEFFGPTLHYRINRK